MGVLTDEGDEQTCRRLIRNRQDTKGPWKRKAMSTMRNGVNCNKCVFGFNTYFFNDLNVVFCVQKITGK